MIVVAWAEAHHADAVQVRGLRHVDPIVVGGGPSFGAVPLLCIHVEKAIAHPVVPSVNGTWTLNSPWEEGVG